jgi:hypothetical protein
MNKPKCDLIQFFPVNVWRIKIKQTKQENSRLIKKIKLIQKLEKSRKKSNRGGYHSPLFKYYDVIGGEFDFLYKNVINLMNQVVIPKEKGLLLEGTKQSNFYTLIEENISVMWFIINKKGHSNAKHVHPPAWYTGVYYVKKPKNSGDIILHDPIPERSFEYTSHTSSAMETNEGELILFPGWFQHSVGENMSNKERMVISFNITRPDYVIRKD